MPRIGRCFKKRKGFYGIRRYGQAVSSENVPPTEESSETVDSLPRLSASQMKISPNITSYDQFDSEQVLDIVNLRNLGDVITSFAACKKCKGEIFLRITGRNGLASTVLLECKNCDSTAKVKNSEISTCIVEGNEKRLESINLRFVFALRAIGKGLAAGNILCGMMNLPPPTTKFQTHQKAIGAILEKVAKESMKAVIEETCTFNNGNKDISISLDGTWQKRGHTSFNGIVSAASMETGKIVDIEVLSKYCRCKKKNEHNESCVANYSGTSGGMEVLGVTQMFQRSLQTYGVRYINYLGDGDSKGFLNVLQSKPYGDDVKIQKLECVGHIQKRMGSRLRKLKADGKRLSDGKSIGGRGRLTDNCINSIQNYYGLAIRRNVGNLQNMKKAVWAVYFHIASSNADRAHELCDLEWCKYKKATAEGIAYDHDKHFHLQSVIVSELKQIFRDLSQPSLLEKCLHGKTQNTNESFNNYIWSRLPKNIFVWLHTLRLGAYDAVACYNDGNIARCRVLQALNIDPGKFCVDRMKKEDLLRIWKGDLDFLEASKSERQKRAKAKRKLEEDFEKNDEGPSYGPGLF